MCTQAGSHKPSRLTIPLAVIDEPSPQRHSIHCCRHARHCRPAPGRLHFPMAAKRGRVSLDCEPLARRVCVDILEEVWACSLCEAGTLGHAPVLWPRTRELNHSFTSCGTVVMRRFVRGSHRLLRARVLRSLVDVLCDCGHRDHRLLSSGPSFSASWSAASRWHKRCCHSRVQGLAYCGCLACDCARQERSAPSSFVWHCLHGRGEDVKMWLISKTRERTKLMTDRWSTTNTKRITLKYHRNCVQSSPIKCSPPWRRSVDL